MSEKGSVFFWALVVAGLCLCVPSTALTQETGSRDANSRVTVQQPVNEEASLPSAVVPSSDAERIAAIENLLRSDRARVESLQEELARLQKDF